MTTLTKRIITALVLAAVVLSVLFVFPGAPTLVFFSLFLLIGLWEWSGFLGCGVLGRVLYLAGGVLIAAAAYLGSDARDVSLILRASLLWWLAVAVWLALRPIRYGRLLTACTGYFCLLPAWLALLVVFSEARGAWLFVWLAVIVAAADVGAYFTGKRFGQRRLAPQLSPGKTVEGVIGGLLGAATIAAVGGAVLGMNVLLSALLGPVLAAVSVVGDLTVSAFKRNAGLKDTGWVLPGHGGVMDRVDGLVAAAPFFAVILSFLRF